MASAPEGPTREIGAPVPSSPFGTVVLSDRETKRDLRWPRSVEHTYPLMLNDAQVDGLYRGATLPILSYDWRIDPNGAKPAAVDRVRADLGLDLVGEEPQPRPRSQRRFVWKQHLQDALRTIGYGHYAFEQVGEIIDSEWRLRKLAARPPATIKQFKVAPDGGLEWIRVPALNPAENKLIGVKLPIENLLVYVWDKEGANWHGRSMLRSLYRPWKLKDRVMRVGAINIERAGGVPYIEGEEGDSPARAAELAGFAKQFRVGEEAGGYVPHGATLKFASAAGGDKAIEFVRLQNEEMARAWLMMLMQLGQTQSGARALGETFVDFLRLAQHAIADFICDVFNQYMIEDSIDWNEGPDEPYAPLLTYEDQSTDEAAGKILVEAVSEAHEEGALPDNSQAAATIGIGRRPVTRATAMRRPPVKASTPTPAEEAQTDFAALQARFEEALAELTATWKGVQAAQIDQLVIQVEQATSIDQLAEVTPKTAGASALTSVLNDVLAHGADTAVTEAAAQGHTLAAPDLAAAETVLANAAEATAILLARDLGQSAASKAVSLASGGLDSTGIAAQVRDHLESLAGATPEYEIAGLVTRAQNEGRFTAMEAAPAGTGFYSSELNDTNTCDPCKREDGDRFSSLTDARRDYPAGGYVACEGGNRCRGTVVAVYDETPGQAR